MSDILKCPICNSNLIITRLCDGIFPNPNKGKIDEIFCDKCKMHGTEELWQELIRTRKENEDKQAVLNCVVDMLKTLNQRYALIMGKDVIKETVRLLEQDKGGDNE